MKSYFSLMETEEIAAVIKYANEAGLMTRSLKEKVFAHTTDEPTNEYALHLTLEVLAELGYFDRDEGGYAASDNLRKLVADESFNWDALSYFVATGNPWISINKTNEDTDEFYSKFFNSVDYVNDLEATAKTVAHALPMKPKNVLDVGAGTGVWSLAIAQNDLHVRVTAVDFPKVLEKSFLPNAAKNGCLDRCAIVPGDFHDTDLGTNQFDLVMLGSIMHLVNPLRVHAFIESVTKSLQKDGLVIIIGHFANATPQQKLATALYSLRLAMRTSGSRNFSISEVDKICKVNGLDFFAEISHDGPDFMAVRVYKKRAEQ